MGILIVSQGAVWSNRISQVFPTSIRLLSLIIIGHVVLMQLIYRELRPYLSPWDIGTIQVWEMGEGAVHILAARPLNSEGRGWYLLELKGQSSYQVH